MISFAGSARRHDRATDATALARRGVSRPLLIESVNLDALPAIVWPQRGSPDQPIAMAARRNHAAAGENLAFKPLRGSRTATRLRNAG